MMERRELFKILGAGVVAAHEAAAQHSHAGPSAASNYAARQPQFFTQDEYALVDRLCEIIVPADQQSPGAHEAGVKYYIDTVLNYSEPGAQELWRNGLKAVDDAAQAKFNKRFAECSLPQQDQIVAAMAGGEQHPSNDLERFFVEAKHLTLDGFFLSDVGSRQYLGYKGNTVLSEFPGCTHPAHKR